ncbi:MAG: hypothetical protein ABR497_00540 [Kiritimatiellia bacterium]|nr:hypothetical protein [Lentisphaerota bacterium]
MKVMAWISGVIMAGALALGVTGCEWTSGGGVEDWTETGYDWANFSGNYRAPDGNVLVRQFGADNIGNIWTTNSSRDELIGQGNGYTTEFSGRLFGVPIPGTLTIVVGSYRFTDNASNTGQGSYNLSVTPVDGSSGSIQYGSRFWSLKFPAPIDDRTPIMANYLYLVNDEHGGQGNHGEPIYSFVVHHNGNRLQLVDSNGTVYDGNIGTMATTGGQPYDPSSDDGPPQTGNVFAQFHVQGFSQGYHVHINGTLQGAFATGTSGRSLTGRTMQATYVEVGGQDADIMAVVQN